VFVRSREQFRLNGKLTIVGPEHADETLLQVPALGPRNNLASQQQFRSFSDHSKNCYMPEQVPLLSQSRGGQSVPAHSLASAGVRHHAKPHAD